MLIDCAIDPLIQANLNIPNKQSAQLVKQIQRQEHKFNSEKDAHQLKLRSIDSLSKAKREQLIAGITFKSEDVCKITD